MPIGVIGIDGADVDEVNRLIGRGRLPNLEALSYDDQAHRVQTHLPAMSASIWTTYVTGVSPGQHGIFDFFDVGSVTKLKTSRHVTVPRIWDMLSSDGKRCLVINVPLTYPPEQLNGIMVSGVMSKHNDGDVWPEEYKETIQPYTVEPPLDFESVIGGDIITQMDNAFTRRASAFASLFELGNFDFFFVVFNLLDRGGHYFYGERELIRMYENVDALVGEIMEMCPGWDLLVLSDHGFRSVEKYFFIEEWLLRQGLSDVKITGFDIPNSLLRLIRLVARFIPRNRELQRKIYHKHIGKRGIYHPWSAIRFYSNASRYLLCHKHRKKEVIGRLKRCEYIKTIIDAEEYFTGKYVDPRMILLEGVPGVEIVRGFGQVVKEPSEHIFYPSHGTHRWGGAMCLGNVQDVPKRDVGVAEWIIKNI